MKAYVAMVALCGANTFVSALAAFCAVDQAASVGFGIGAIASAVGASLMTFALVLEQRGGK